MMAILVTALAVCLGLFVFQLFAAFAGRIERSSKSQELESKYANNYIARNAELVELLGKIGKPELRSGHYSERQEAMWKVYNAKAETHERLAEEERRHVLDSYFGE